MQSEIFATAAIIFLWCSYRVRFPAGIYKFALHFFMITRHSRQFINRLCVTFAVLHFDNDLGAPDIRIYVIPIRRGIPLDFFPCLLNIGATDGGALEVIYSNKPLVECYGEEIAHAESSLLRTTGGLIRCCSFDCDVKGVDYDLADFFQIIMLLRNFNDASIAGCV